jgi:hypothetical protein
MSVRPLLDTLADMTAASRERADLGAHELMLVGLSRRLQVGRGTQDVRATSR